MLPSILIVDDEVEVLNALQRALRDRFRVVTFSDPILALDYFKESPTHIVLSDMKMPQMNGAEFLSAVSNVNEHSKRVALTGFADVSMAKQAINEGQVSFYLNKPWDNKELIEKLEELVNELRKQRLKVKQIKKLSLDKKNLLQENQASLLIADMLAEEKKDVLKSVNHLKSINVELLHLNANLIAMYTDDIVGHSLRVADQGKNLAKQLGLSEIDCLNIYLAGLFHRVGVLGGKENTADWLSMSVQKKTEYYSFAQTSAEIMSSTTLLKTSATIVKHLFERFDGKGVPYQLSKGDIPIGSRILRAIISLDRIIHGKEYKYVITPREAFQKIRKFSGSILDGVVVNKLCDMLDKSPVNCEVVSAVQHLLPNMELAHDIIDSNGHKLLAEDTVLNNQIIKQLLKYQKQTSVPLLAYIKPQRKTKYEND